MSYAPDSRDARRLNGGGINTIPEYRAGTLWVGAFDGLYRYDRRSGAFARYTAREGLPSRYRLEGFDPGWNEQFRLRVRDNGRGIDKAAVASHETAGHFGLRGMTERTALLGGKLAVWSEVDGGTELELRLPANIVYVTIAKRSWWSRLLAKHRHVQKETHRERRPFAHPEEGFSCGTDPCSIVHFELELPENLTQFD